MTSSPWWLTALFAPAVYFFAVKDRFPGFTKQPGLVLARNPERFDSRLADAGDADAARAGVLVDVGFAALLGGAAGVVIAAAGGPCWVVLPAFVLDLIEGLALWVIVGRTTHARGAVRTLFGIAVLKFLAYGASWVVLAYAVCHLLPSTSWF